MIVVFQSESENKSIKRVERVLDAYANRIGRRSWMTAITQEGLDAVHHELRKIAAKDTSVSCVLVKGKTQTELLWIVGRRDRFNSVGNVPVNETSKTKYIVKDEEKWGHMPLLSSLTAMAALWHDAGKSSDWFQEKLKKAKVIGDPLRHEWVSCMMLFAFIKSVDAKTDDEWLMALTKGDIDECKIENILKTLNRDRFFGEAADFPVFLFISWLILSHHRLPASKNERKECLSYRNVNTKAINNINTFFRKIVKASLSYSTAIGSEEDYRKVVSFSRGISLFSDAKWKKETAKWAERLIQNKEIIEQADKENSLYEIMMLSRCALVLGDHHQSSLAGTAGKEDVLIANLVNGKPNQTLTEHILGVESFALKAAYLIPSLLRELPKAYDIKLLKSKSPAKFIWQDKAKEAVNEAKNKIDLARTGCFIINMASTGCGKTIANAKILHSISDDESLRCSILLGLRTLTLQTGEEYRKRLGLNKEDLSIIVGSKAFVELSHISTNTDDDTDEDESRSSNLGVDNVETSFIFEKLPIEEIIADTEALKMLYPPVLVSTIDQVIQASEDTVGAHNIIPILRIMSSDIVIDEVDDYSGDDLIAVARLVYLCGVFGRKVLISSATIPPEESEGLAAAYQRGWAEHASLHRDKNQMLCILSDEFSSKTFVLDTFKDITKENIFRKQFREQLKSYIEKRIQKLKKKGSPRKGEIVPVATRTQNGYFATIVNEIRTLHSRHKETDPVTLKNISFGLVRFSNIKQCILFSRYLDENGLGEDTDMRFITYHARTVMLIRHTLEKYLDRILSRKNPEEIYNDSIIRKHIDNSKKKDIVFIVISSPVEELGRDHDFDWAVIEPASYRSIIQTSGRVLRHRESINTVPNIGIMQYNWKALSSNNNNDVCYCRPGFEEASCKLGSHDLYALIKEDELKTGITSIPRISYIEYDEVKDFTSLEHEHVARILEEKESPEIQDFAAFYKSPIMLSALSQKIHPFRMNDGENKELTLFYDEERLIFKENIGGNWQAVSQINGIKIKNQNFSFNDWLNLSYIKIVNEFSNMSGMDREYVQKRYGSLCFTYYENKSWIYSDKYGLEEKVE